jgi:hypothetical protein
VPAQVGAAGPDITAARTGLQEKREKQKIKMTGPALQVALKPGHLSLSIRGSLLSVILALHRSKLAGCGD